MTIASEYQSDVADYWNAERNPVNLRLGDVSGIYHHHYGIGAADRSVLDIEDEKARDEAVIRELHRLENDQAAFLLGHLGDIRPEHRLLDAGCGRGGSSILANAAFGCRVDGVSISQQQVDFANERATERGVADKVRFHFRNMLDTGFESGSFQASWNNESTMYVVLDDLFAEHSRLLARGGRYVTITGCYNDVYGLPSRAVSTINAHYVCDIHPRSAYFRAMAAHRLVPCAVVDLTAQTIPYWELRRESSVATGIEDTFLEAYREGGFQYLLIAADRV
ncbi:geranyl diphosphate 2-C-methyltransferase [Actinomadura kijaniata]|uniref:geranyl diphosphate 2-C-methyltransferase n=1 Tax=Actinomadura kijaniata TaxID=46161 RepID=UPI000834DE92|nr:geranyl diphosphate 2-C-methyltransferase [Actinomadura kijaniata]